MTRKIKKKTTDIVENGGDRKGNLQEKIWRAKMGASSSTEQKVSSEQRELESIAASTGALPMLKKTFSKLADPQSNALPINALQVPFNNPFFFFLNYQKPHFFNSFPYSMP